MAKLAFGEGRPPYHSFNLSKFGATQIVNVVVVYDRWLSAYSNPPGTDPETWGPIEYVSVEVQLPDLIVRLRLVDISPDNEKIKEAASMVGVTAFFLATVLITGYK
jgi:hypothetical protein